MNTTPHSHTSQKRRVELLTAKNYIWIGMFNRHLWISWSGIHILLVMLCFATALVDGKDNKIIVLSRDFHTTQTDIIYGGRCEGMAKNPIEFQCHHFPCSDGVMWEKKQERGVIMKEWAGGWLCSACTVYIHHCQDSLRGIIYSPMGCTAPHTLLILIWPERERDGVGSSEFSIHFCSSQSVSRGQMDMTVSGHAEGCWCSDCANASFLLHLFSSNHTEKLQQL